MSKIEVNTIDVQCGSTLTVGSSGKTVSLATGASQTGFGRTGTVDWCTTAKTSPFTAVSGDGFFVNTTSGGITVTLPSSPSAGDIVALKDYANKWDCNAVTLCRNGSKINGQCTNATLNTESQSVTLIYVDDTKGWQDIQDSTSNITGTTFISASGGTETTSGNFKIHTFNSDANFVVSSASNSAPLNDVSFLVVAGGGGGAGDNGAGGGAGGFRENKGAEDSYTASPLNGATPITVSAQTYPITIGGGGAKGTAPTYNGCNGSNSVFSTITSAGGGRGGTGNSVPGTAGANGGSGGGGGRRGGSAGSGNTPPVSPAQGFAGGAGAPGGAPAVCTGSDGGGGATVAGVSGKPTSCAGSGCGGAGATTSITASPVAYAGGGGGSLKAGHPQPQASGGTGGGGNFIKGGTPTAGTANTGGGGAGCAAGGSGVVIIRYKFQ